MSIPQAMRDADRWIIWRSVTNKKGGLDKRPLNPRTKKPFARGSGWPTDPSLWVSYDEAVKTGEPLGFMLGDGWAGIDLDDVIENGTPVQWAQQVMRRFDTYAEISPSDTGIKMFMRGAIEGDPIGKRAGIEVYDRQRFFTVTGRALTTIGIGDCDDELQALYELLKRGDTLELCRLRGLVLSSGKPGYVDLTCPWVHEHTGGGNHTSTSLHVTDGAADGFKCLHAHCADRTIGDVRKWLGLPAWIGGQLNDLDAKGHPINDSQDNIRVALQALGVKMRYNVFLRKPLVSWPTHNNYDGAFDDEVRNRIWLTIDEQFKFRPTAQFFDTVMNDLARRQPFHPVRDYLSSLEWDRTPRLDKWLITYAGADDTNYTRAVGSLFLRAAVNRVFSPGCKFDEMLVLISAKQGLLKSSLFKALPPRPAWFSDDLPLGADSKETIERTGGVWIAEVSDLHGYNARELNQVKAFLSRQADGPVRLAYDRLPTHVDRHFVIGGTTNTLNFLKDKTGNRRFWPIKIGTIDLDGFVRDRDQVWAEAVARMGESIRLDPTLYGEAGKQQRAHQRDDPWMVKLEEDLGLTDGGIPKDRLRLTRPWELLGIPLDQRDERKTERIEDIMVALGYEKKQSRGIYDHDKDTQKRWCHTDPEVARRAKEKAPLVQPMMV